MACHLLLLLELSMVDELVCFFEHNETSKMSAQKRIKSPGCLLDSGISKVPCVLSLVRVPTLQISHVQLRLRV